MASEQHKKYWEALQRLINAAWHKPDAAMAFTIPPDEEHDADLILSRALHRLEEAEALLELGSLGWWLHMPSQGDNITCAHCSVSAPVPGFQAHLPGGLRGWIEHQPFPHWDYCFVVKASAFLGHQKEASDGE